MSRALNWISDDAQRDLDTVRGIRNDFAHSYDHNLSFSAQSVSDRCKSLRSAQAYIDGFESAANAPHRKFSRHSILAMQSAFQPPRLRYTLAVEFLSQYLDELQGSTLTYSGTDLLAEIRDLSANIRITSSITLTAIPASTADSSVENH